MNWLIWREYRQNRVVLTAGAVLLLLPYIFTLVGTIVWYWWGNWPTDEASPVATAVGFAALYSILFSQLTVAILGGNTIAGDRADRSAQFIAYLPLRRTRLVVAKLCVALSVVALIWGANSLVLWGVTSLVPNAQAALHSFESATGFYLVAITGVTFYSVSWLISSFQSSPTFAAGGGLVTPLILIASLHAATWSFGVDWRSAELIVGVAYAIICPILAIACFSLGTWYYLRRVEP